MSNVKAVVDRLMKARKGGGLLDPDFVAKHPLTEKEALEVQNAVMPQVGPVGGWKIAGSSKPGAYSLGPIAAANVKPSPAKFPKGHYLSRGMECEIAFRIGKDLTKPPYDLKAVMDAIDAAMAAFEIVESRLAQPKAAGYPWGLVDNQSSGGLVYGTPLTDWRKLDPKKEAVVLKFDGKVAKEVPSHNATDLVERVMLLANTVGGHCGGVRKGQIILTGSMTGNIPVPEGTVVTADYATLGSLRCEL